MEISARIVTLRLAETFVISRESQDEVEVVEVELRHGGVSGFGEAAPIGRYDQTAASALAWLEQVDPGDDAWAPLELPPGEPAARAGLDAAALDLQGKLVELPVWRLLDLRRDGPPTSWTVWLGDPDAMAQRAEAAARRGFRRLKLKLGGRDGLDLDSSLVDGILGRELNAALVRLALAVVFEPVCEVEGALRPRQIRSGQTFR